MSFQALAKQDFKAPGQDTQEVIAKIDNLFEQNKIIARGLTLMHDKIQGTPMQMPQSRQVSSQIPRAAPKQLPSQQVPQRIFPSPAAPIQNSIPKPIENLQGYEQSLTSTPKEFKKLGPPPRDPNKP